MTVRNEHETVPEREARRLRGRVVELETELAQIRSAKTLLEARETQLEHAQQLARMGSWESNLETGASVWSDETYRLLGMEPGEITPRFKGFLNFVHPDDRARVEDAVGRALAGTESYDVHMRMIRRDGKLLRVHARGTVVFDAHGRAQRFYGMFIDMTEEETARAALARSEHRFRLIAETINDLFWMSTPGITEMIYVSPAYDRIWGRSRESLYENPRSFADAIHPDDRPRILAGFAEHAQGNWDFEYRILQPDGSVRWIADRGYPIYDESGQLTLLTGIATDITARREAQERLESTLRDLRRAQAETEQLMLHDPLTGVANRRLLDRYILREWRREERESKRISLLIVDVDHFKDYNDHYGHLPGDDCLTRVAGALAANLNRPADLVARYGGEEFLLVLPDTDLQGAYHKAEALRAAVAALCIPHAASPVAERVTISVGVYSADPRAIAFREALARADQALYRAKQEGRNRVGAVQPLHQARM